MDGVPTQTDGTTGQMALDSQDKTFAEFFAGIGLVRTGLAASGWQCVYANDIDAKKREIYEANFPGVEHFDQRDVWDTEGALAQIGDAPFLATSSFPCVDLSLAGGYKGIHGKHSSTFFGFTKVIRELSPRPALLLFENVPGFLSSRNGEDFQNAAAEIADMGYRLDAFLLNAQAFVPQSRMRIFLVALHEDVHSSVVIPKPRSAGFGDEWCRAIDPFPSLRPPKLVDLMERTPLRTGWMATPIRPPVDRKPTLRPLIDLDESQAWWDEAQLTKHYEMLDADHRARIDRCIADKGSFVGTAYRRKRAGGTRLEVRFDGVAGCLRTPSGGSGRQIIVAVDAGVLRMRWMSPREYARLQGVPSFKHVGTERQMLFGFGDAVCVPVIEWIDTCVLTPIFNSAKRAGAGCDAR